MTRHTASALADTRAELTALLEDPATIPVVRRAARVALRHLPTVPHLEMAGSASVATDPVIRCADPRTHRVQHRRVDGVWRCEICRPDPDHAEPLADQVAFEWDLEGGAA